MIFSQIASLVTENPLLFAAAGIITAAFFIGTALSVPFLINLLPSDYFMKENRRESFDSIASRLFFYLVFIIKNTAGIILFFCGFILLFMPGQGLLTILLSLVLLDFPGKWKLQKKLIRRKKVSAAVNWIRRRGGKPEIAIPGDDNLNNYVE